MLKANEVYAGSDGELTRQYYSDLEARGPVGALAMNLFRASKCSGRAKVYRGGIRGKGSYRRMAYERKQWSISNLCKVLLQFGELLGINWGWKRDPLERFAGWVLYVDLEEGQVSFHSPARGEGPDYPGDWDQSHASAERIVRFCDSLNRD